MNLSSGPGDKIDTKSHVLSSQQLSTVVSTLVNQNHAALGAKVKSISLSDELLKLRYPDDVITQKDVAKINQFLDSFGEYMIVTNPITETNFKAFLTGYMKKNAFDFSSITVGIKLIKYELEQQFGKNNTSVTSLTSLIRDSKRIFNDVLNEIFKPSTMRAGLYDMMGIKRDRMGLDPKLKHNQSYQIVMKGVIDELMSIGPVVDYFAREPWECIKALGGILRPLEEFQRTVSDLIGSYTTMFGVDAKSSKGLYEIGKGSTQWLVTLLPTGALKSVLVKSVALGVKTTSKGPGMRAQVDDS